MGKKSKDILILLSILIFSRLLMFSFTSFINGGFNLEHYFSWDSEFYLDNIPNFTVITVIFINNKLPENKLTINNFYQTEENPQTISYYLKHSKKLNGYMIAEQNLFNNNVIMAFLFQNKIDFFTKTIDITEYNTILYSGETDES